MFAAVSAIYTADSRPVNPAAVVLSKQLPLFLAELYALDKPTGSDSGEIFTLYESTGRLLDMWEELCPKLVSLPDDAERG
jgi:hypothetical protein